MNLTCTPRAGWPRLRPVLGSLLSHGPWAMVREPARVGARGPQAWGCPVPVLGGLGCPVCQSIRSARARPRAQGSRLFAHVQEACAQVGRVQAGVRGRPSGKSLLGSPSAGWGPEVQGNGVCGLPGAGSPWSPVDLGMGRAEPLAGHLVTAGCWPFTWGSPRQWHHRCDILCPLGLPVVRDFL